MSAFSGIPGAASGCAGYSNPTAKFRLEIVYLRFSRTSIQSRVICRIRETGLRETERETEQPYFHGLRETGQPYFHNSAKQSAKQNSHISIIVIDGSIDRSGDLSYKFLITHKIQPDLPTYSAWQVP